MFAKLRKRFSKQNMMHALEERMPIQAVKDVAGHKTVPIHKHSYWYYMGGISLFLFLVMVVSGVLLLFHYQPGAESAHASVQRIQTKVQFGWLIRSIHSWAANLMVLAVVIHMFSAYFMKAYQKPREFTWWTGVALLLLVVGFGFTGYLLPWDEVSYFATAVGLDVPVSVANDSAEFVKEYVPIVGESLGTFIVWAGSEAARLLKGGSSIGSLTIQRFFTLHVVVIPWIFIGVLTVHLLLVQIHGNVVPAGVEKKKEYRRVPFFPNFIYADLFMWLLAFNLLATLAALSPWPLGAEADVLAPAPAGIHPEWYFMGSFQVLKIMPKMLAMGLMTAGFIAWALVPLWDPGTKGGRRARFASYVGIATVVGFVFFTGWAYVGLEA